MPWTSMRTKIFLMIMRGMPLYVNSKSDRLMYKQKLLVLQEELMSTDSNDSDSNDVQDDENDDNEADDEDLEEGEDNEDNNSDDDDNNSRGMYIYP